MGLGRFIGLSVYRCRPNFWTGHAGTMDFCPSNNNKNISCETPWNFGKTAWCEPLPTKCNVVKQKHLPLTISEIYLIGSQPSPLLQPFVCSFFTPSHKKNTFAPFHWVICWVCMMMLFRELPVLFGWDMWAESSLEAARENFRSNHQPANRDPPASPSLTWP